MASSALKLDFAALQPGCATWPLFARLCELPSETLSTQWCERCGYFTRGRDAGVQSLRHHDTPQSTDRRAAQGLALEQGGSASEAVTALAAEVRENVKLRQIRWCVCESRLHRLVGSACLRMCFRLSGPELIFGAYAHGGPSRVAGRIGSLVALDTSCALLTYLVQHAWQSALTSACCALAAVSAKDGNARSSVEQLAGQLAMHVAASDPQYLSLQAMPAAVVDAQRAAFQSQVCNDDSCSARGVDVLTAAQASTSGKPANIADKMVEGWMKKWYASKCPDGLQCCFI